MPGAHTVHRSRHQTHTANLCKKLFCMEVRSHTQNHGLSPLYGHHLLITIQSMTPLKYAVTEQVRCCSAACHSAALGLHSFRALHRKEICSFPSHWLSVPATTSPPESMTVLHTLPCIGIDSHGVLCWVFCRRLKSDPHCDYVHVQDPSKSGSLVCNEFWEREG